MEILWPGLLVCVDVRLRARGKGWFWSGTVRLWRVLFREEGRGLLADRRSREAMLERLGDPPGPGGMAFVPVAGLWQSSPWGDGASPRKRGGPFTSGICGTGGCLVALWPVDGLGPCGWLVFGAEVARERETRLSDETPRRERDPRGAPVAAKPCLRAGFFRKR